MSTKGHSGTLKAKFSPSTGFILLFAIVFFLKFANLGRLPFWEDETLYAEMMQEELEHPSFLPAYLGYPAPWKPGISLFAYSLFLPVSSALFSSIEYIYRFPVFIFGLANAYLIYLLTSRFYGRDAGILASLLFYSSILSFYVETSLLMEPFMLFAMLASLVFYTSKEMPENRKFLFGACLAFLAAITKTLIAILIPVLVLAYVLQFERKALKNPIFLSSLLAVPIGIFLFWLSLEQIGLSKELFFELPGELFIYDYANILAFNIIAGILISFELLMPIFAASIASFFYRWKSNLMLSCLFVVFFLLFFFGQRTWYYYYVIPSLAVFASLLLLGKDHRADFFTFMAALSIILISSYLVISIEWNPDFRPKYRESREIGMLVSGKENVLFIGQYSTNTISVSYKILSERQKSGEYLDFGYIIFCPTENEIMPEKSPADFIADYWGSDYQFEGNNFALMYQSNKVLRKNTSITRFDYVVVSPPIENLSLEGYSTYFNGNYSTILIRGD